MSLVEIKERDDLPLVFGIFTGTQQGMAVVKGKANELLTPRNDFLVTNRARLGEGQRIIRRILNQMHHLIELIFRLARLFIQTLGQNHRQQVGISLESTSNRGRVSTSSAGGQNPIAPDHQSVGHQLDDLLVGNWHVARTQYGNALGA